MASELIKGITFDEEDVTSRNDSLFWHYHLSRTDTQYATLNYAIYSDYNDGMGVTTSGLEITVRAGLAVAYGRNVEVELPTILSVGSGELGYVIINIDLNKSPTNQVTVETTTKATLIQENLSGTGLQFQIPIGTYDSTTGVVIFTRETNDVSAQYISDELLTQFLPLAGGTMTGTLYTQKIDTQGYSINTGTGYLFTDFIKVRGGYSDGGVDIANGFKGSGNVSADGYLEGSRVTFNGSSGGQLIKGSTSLNSVTQPTTLMDIDYNDNGTLFRLGRNASTGQAERYWYMYGFNGEGEVQNGLRWYGSRTNGVVHSIPDHNYRLAYADETRAMVLSALDLQRTNLMLDIDLLESQVDDTTSVTRNDNNRILDNKKSLLDAIESTRNQLIDDSQYDEFDIL